MAKTLGFADSERGTKFYECVGKQEMLLMSVRNSRCLSRNEHLMLKLCRKMQPTWQGLLARDQQPSTVMRVHSFGASKCISVWGSRTCQRGVREAECPHSKTGDVRSSRINERWFGLGTLGASLSGNPQGLC